MVMGLWRWRRVVVPGTESNYFTLELFTERRAKGCCVVPEEWWTIRNQQYKLTEIRGAQWTTVVPPPLSNSVICIVTPAPYPRHAMN